MATIQENTDAMDLAFQTHMKNKNPGVDTQTIANIEEFSLAYATAIANAIGAGSSGGTGVNMSDYIKKSGGADGVMSGLLTANNGLSAGWGAINQISTGVDGVAFNQDIDQQTGALKGHGKIIIQHDTNALLINGGGDFESTNIGGQLKALGSLQVGENLSTALVVSPTEFSYKGGSVYHAGNANRGDADWNMLNAAVDGVMVVGGWSQFNSSVTINNGLTVNHVDVEKFRTTDSGIVVSGNISLPANGEIISGQSDTAIIKDHANDNVSLNSAGGSLFLGYENTTKTILSSDLYNENGDRLLIDKFGAGSFLWDFEMGAAGNAKLFTNDTGVTVNGYIHLQNSSVRLNQGNYNSLGISTPYGRTEIGVTSNYQGYCSFYTTAESFLFRKNLYVAENNSISILGSSTKISAGQLFLSSYNYLQNVNDGIKHYGNSYMVENIGTESFSGGFSGNGWRITPDSVATFTDLIVRNKLKVYEFEVQKITASNGSFWVSANASGEKVTKL